jgi:hypothetical protein
VERISASSSATEQIDELRMKVPRVTMEDVSREYDKYAKALRVLDTKIQEANWKYTVDFDESVYLPEGKAEAKKEGR